MRNSPLAASLLTCLTLAALTMGGCSAPSLELSEARNGPAQTRVLTIRDPDSGREGPELVLTRDVWGFGLEGYADGRWVFHWSGIGLEHEYKVALSAEGALQLENVASAAKVVAGPEEQIYLSSPGLHVAAPAERAGFLPALANCPLYLGLELVNSGPLETFPRGVAVRVAKVDPNSPAHQAGVQVGDVLEEASTGSLTHSIQTRQGLAAWLADLSEGNPIRFKLKRGEEAVSIEVKSRRREPSEFRTSASVSDAPEFLVSH